MSAARPSTCTDPWKDQYPLPNWISRAGPLLPSAYRGRSLAPATPGYAPSADAPPADAPPGDAPPADSRTRSPGAPPLPPEDEGLGAVLPDGQIPAPIGIEVGHGGRAGVPVHLDPAPRRVEDREPARPVAEEHGPAARVMASETARRREVVLRQKEVLATVAVEVRHGDAEGGGELGGRRQRARLEPTADVEKDGVEQRDGARPVESRAPCSEEVVDGTPGEGFERGGLAPQEGERRPEREQVAHGPADAVGPGLELDEVDEPVPVEIRRDHADRPLGAREAPGVRSPGRHRQVRTAIAVEVPGRDAVPAAGVRVQAPGLRRVAETPSVVLQQPHGPPLQGEEKVGIAVIVDIGEHGAGDEADLPQGLGGVRVDDPVAALGQKQSRVGGQGVGAGGRAGAGEEVEVAVSVHIGGRQGPRRVAAWRDGRRGARIEAGEGRNRVEVGRRACFPGADARDDDGATGRGERDDGRVVADGGGADGHGVHQPPGFVDGELGAAARPRPDEQIGIAVRIRIDPRHARAAPGQLERHQRLPGQLVEGRFAMPPDRLRPRKERRAAPRADVGARPASRGRPHLVGVVREHPDRPAPSRRPGDRRFRRLAIADREGEPGIRTGEVHAARRHLPRLIRRDRPRRRRPREHDARPDRLRVAALPEHAQGDPGPPGVVAQHERRFVQSRDHHVPVPVAVEVRRRDPVAHVGLRPVSPLPGPVDEGAVAEIAEGKVPQPEWRKHSEFLAPVDLDAAGPQRLLRVPVERVPPVSVRDQQVLVTVEVDVEEHRAPGPFRGVEPGGARRLGPRPVAAVELQSVPVGRHPRRVSAGRRPFGRAEGDLLPSPHRIRPRASPSSRSPCRRRHRCRRSRPPSRTCSRCGRRAPTRP